MHLPEIDKYAHLSSPFHSWDPRAKILSLSFLIFSITFLTDLLSASFALILALIFVFLSRIPFSFVLKQLRWVALFVLFFLVIMPLSVPGEEIARVKFISISGKGLHLAALIALRAVSICLLIFPMIGTTRFHKTLKAMERLRLPNKLIQIIMFTYRYIFVLLDELIRMFTAAQARLFKKRTNIHTLKIISNLIGTLFVRGFERTQNVYNAMASRGYKGRLKTLDEFRLCRKDFLKAFFTIALGLILNLTRLVL